MFRLLFLYIYAIILNILAAAKVHCSLNSTNKKRTNFNEKIMLVFIGKSMIWQNDIERRGQCFANERNTD